MTERSIDSTNKGSRPSPDSGIEQVRHKKIGDQLKRLYDDVTSEPVPDEFLKLLEQADSFDLDDNDDDQGGS